MAKTREAAAAKGCVGAASLQYRRPWAVFAPTVVAFLLLNYLACCTTVNADGTDLVVPSGVVALQEERSIAGSAKHGDYFSAQLFLDDYVMRKLFRIARFFGGMDGIRIFWSLAWMMHCLELGIAVRICVSCKATPLVCGLYTILTLVGGATQLVPLLGARKEYLSGQRNDKRSNNGAGARSVQMAGKR